MTLAEAKVNYYLIQKLMPQAKYALLSQMITQNNYHTLDEFQE